MDHACNGGSPEEREKEWSEEKTINQVLKSSMNKASRR